MNTTAEQSRWRTPLVLCLAGTGCGALLGAILNVINDLVSSDYFAIVMSWDGMHSILLPVAVGLFQGAALGLLFGFVLAVVSAASTRLRCPLPLALHMLRIGVTIACGCWVFGGLIGLMWAKISPHMWGTVFAGVPSRVSLPRYAWVGGSSFASYIGAPLAAIFCSVMLHERWKQMNAPISAFPVLTQAANPRVQ